MKSIVKCGISASDVAPVNDIYPHVIHLEDDIYPHVIPLEDVSKFIMTVPPSEYELKKIYEYNFVLNEITEDGYYVFIKEE